LEGSVFFYLGESAGKDKEVWKRERSFLEVCECVLRGLRGKNTSFCFAGLILNMINFNDLNMI